jgi:hypothetical protein
MSVIGTPTRSGSRVDTSPGGVAVAILAAITPLMAPRIRAGDSAAFDAEISVIRSGPRRGLGARRRCTLMCVHHRRCASASPFSSAAAWCELRHQRLKWLLHLHCLHHC